MQVVSGKVAHKGVNEFIHTRSICLTDLGEIGYGIPPHHPVAHL